MSREPDGRISQLRKGLVEMAILAIVSRGEAYGTEILDSLGEYPGLAITSGTVYPLLSRLKKAGLIDATWQESPVGPPRKYYRLSRKGAKELDGMRRAWTDVSLAMDEVLEEAGSR